jgi:hypothetical protein
MIDVFTVIDRLRTETPYKIELAKDTLPNLQELRELPIIFVNYYTIEPRFPNIPLESSIFDTHGENLIQTFEVHIVCDIKNFREVWIKHYNALIGWNPIAEEVRHSGFTYAQSGKMGLSNGKYWEAILWRIGFPTTTQLL